MQTAITLSATVVVAAALAGCGDSPAASGGVAAADPGRAACEALLTLPNLSITQARLVDADGVTPRYCYV